MWTFQPWYRKQAIRRNSFLLRDEMTDIGIEDSCHVIQQEPLWGVVAQSWSIASNYCCTISLDAEGTTDCVTQRTSARTASIFHTISQTQIGWGGQNIIFGLNTRSPYIYSKSNKCSFTLKNNNKMLICDHVHPMWMCEHYHRFGALKLINIGLYICLMFFNVAQKTLWWIAARRGGFTLGSPLTAGDKHWSCLI